MEVKIERKNKIEKKVCNGVFLVKWTYFYKTSQYFSTSSMRQKYS